MAAKRMSMIATATTMMTGRIIDLLLWKVLVGSGLVLGGAVSEVGCWVGRETVGPGCCEVCVGETQVDVGETQVDAGETQVDAGSLATVEKRS